jgi:hypothetical protein
MHAGAQRVLLIEYATDHGVSAKSYRIQLVRQRMSKRELRIRSLCVFVLISNGIAFYSPLAHSNEAMPTHCRQDEFSFVNAKVHRIDTNKADTKTSEGATEKFLSLCADRDKEPLTRISYRFGAIGKIEIEMVASAQNKAGLSTQSDSGAHAGLISIQFNKGPYTYEVSEGMGMTSGVSLLVYKSRKNILAFRSDDYESQMILINFDKISSPIFKRVKPIEPW